MKKNILKLVAFSLIAGSVLPAQAGIVQDTIESAKDKARELLAVPMPPVREKTQFEKVMDAIAGKYTRLKKCIKGEQACNKSDFAILGATAIMAYSFTLGLRQALTTDFRASKKANDLEARGLQFYQFMKLTTKYDPLVMIPANAGEALFQKIFGKPGKVSK